MSGTWGERPARRTAPDDPSPDADDAGAGDAARPDPVAVAAYVAGVVGLIVFGLLLAIVTAVLAAVAGQRAREARRPLAPAYGALALAVADGVVWLAVHYLLDVKAVVG